MAWSRRRRLLARHGLQAVLMIDLDRFKPINDTLGHEVGDRVLVEVAQRLRAAVREADVVARWAATSLWCCCPRCPIGPARGHGAACAGVSHPMAGEHLVQVGASVGVALPPGDGRSLKDLMLAADRAVYRAKQGAAATPLPRRPCLSRAAGGVRAHQGRARGSVGESPHLSSSRPSRAISPWTSPKPLPCWAASARSNS
jgi:diguanylate cyclase (GGDEF)-like protein